MTDRQVHRQAGYYRQKGRQAVRLLQMEKGYSRHAAKKTDRQTNTQTGRQVDTQKVGTQTNRQIGRQTDCSQTGRQLGIQADRQIDRKEDRQVPG